MKILRYQAQGIHGYLDVAAKFNPDLTFLTGNNGAGKSSVIHSIVAILTPSIGLLARIEFSKIQLTIEHNSKTIHLRCLRDASTITLSVLGVQDILAFPVFQEEPNTLNLRIKDREEEDAFYQAQQAKTAEHPVVILLASLPPLMFLDLDRRSTGPDGDIFVSSLRRRRERNIFGSLLIQSLAVAAALAEREYRSLQSQVTQIDERYRRELAENLITVSEQRFFGS